MVCRMSLNKAPLPATIGPNRLAIRFPKEYDSQYDLCRSEDKPTIDPRSTEDVSLTTIGYLELELIDPPKEIRSLDCGDIADNVDPESCFGTTLDAASLESSRCSTD